MAIHSGLTKPFRGFLPTSLSGLREILRDVLREGLKETMEKTLVENL